MSSVGVEEMDGTASNGDGHVSATESATTARSFARSTASSSDVNSVIVPSVDWPGVDGVSAGRSAAIGALCRIICSKNSKETLTNLQLAQFYKVMYEALFEKDRLVLCSLIYYGGNMFRLGLKGIEVLLPLFVLAVDIVLTESTKLRLHPSISEVEMRRACLQAFSSVLAWPTTFGAARISDPSYGLSSGSGRTISGEHSTAYIELLPRIHRNLIYSLRHETDSCNLHLTLAMCNILCEESCMFDRSFAETRGTSENNMPSTATDEDDEKDYCVSVIRSVVSAICDNICKTQWSSDLSICLAAIDCLNAIASLHPSALFYRKDMSTGFLIVTSLCRFIDMQLAKPPPLHSRDLHSSVVAAFTSLVVWLCAAPNLVETESCLTNVAEVIEFGLTGGKNLPIADRKPASKRVHDAAEHLLYNLLSSVSLGNQKEIANERTLLCRYGSNVIDLTKFKHFLIKQDTLISIHDASNVPSVAPGCPGLFFVLRSPHHSAVAALTQLISRPGEQEEVADEKDSETAHSEENSSVNFKATPVKAFEIPAGFEKIRCKLDSVIPDIQSTAETDRILTELNDIRKKIQHGESVVRSSDERNVWLQEPLASVLAESPHPKPSPDRCDADRVFLYDMGFVSEALFKAGEFVMLGSEKNEEFYKDLHQMVDRSPTKLLQSVCIFYVRADQRIATEILENANNVENTCAEFCKMLSELGEGVEVSSHPHWTGNWATAFSSELSLEEPKVDEADSGYVIDGVSHCLWWADSQIEVAYTMPSERCRKTNHTYQLPPPTVVCTFDDSDENEHGFQSKKLQHQLSIASGTMSTLSPPKYRQHSLYSPNHSSSISPLSTSSSSSGLAPPNAHAQLPISSRRKSLLAIASPSMIACGAIEPNKDDLIAIEGKHPLLFASVKSDASQHLPRFHLRSRTFDSRLTKSYKQRKLLTSSSPDFQLLGCSAENDRIPSKVQSFITRQRAFSGGRKPVSHKGSVISDKPKGNKYQLLMAKTGAELQCTTDHSHFELSPSYSPRLNSSKSALHSPNGDYSLRDGSGRRSLHTAVASTYSLQPYMSSGSPRLGMLGQRRSWTTDDSDMFALNISKERPSFGLFKSFFRRKTPEPPQEFAHGIMSPVSYVCDRPPIDSDDNSERQRRFDMDGDSEVKSTKNGFLEDPAALHHCSSEEHPTSEQVSGEKAENNSQKSQHPPSSRTKSASATASSTVSGSTYESQTYISKRNADQRIFVVWLERIEDMRHFPIEEMFDVSSDGSPAAYGFPGRPDYVAIFICQIEGGLVQISIKGNFTKCGLPGPLFNGCVVSNSSLPALLRLTVISIARRKTLELENYQMVYSRRRQAIQEFGKKYAVEFQSYTDLVERLVGP